LKTVIQLLVVALIVNGCVRMGAATWRNYQLKDAIEQEARFANTSTTADLHARIMQLAEEFGVVLEAGDVALERRSQDIHISVAYVESIPLVPGIYTREHLFEFESRIRAMSFEKVR